MGESISWDSKLLLGKIETSEGTDSGPDGSNAILTSGLEANIYQGDSVNRELDKGNTGNSEQINVNPHNTLSFGIEAAGAGTAGQIPAYAPILRACGMAEIIESDKVRYVVADSDHESATLVYLDDDKKIITTGCRGTFGLNLSPGSFAKFEFSDFTGKYNRPTILPDPAPVPVYDGFQDPRAVTADNTPIFKVDSLDICVQEFSFELGRSVSFKDLINCVGAKLGKPESKASLTLLAPSIAERNWFEKAESHAGITTMPIVIQHGTDAGNIFDLTIGKCQIISISQTDIDGSIGYQLELNPLNNSFEIGFR